jgi:Zn-dependent peptidase ImmA (M78 family)/transcriptional regulator with XRE-family HTH domain
LAREAAGLSLRALEDAIRGLVSAQAIGKYENNLMMPGSGVLLALARALRVSPEYLLSSRQISLSGVDFRKEPSAGVKAEKAVAAMVIDQLERYLTIESLLPHARRDWVAVDHGDFPVEVLDDAEKAADQLRELWKLGVDPVASMVDLLEEKGIKVVALDLPLEVSGSKALARADQAGDVAVIVVNKNHNGERQRFTLAHELAHLILRPSGALIDDEASLEKASDRFAGAFLVPAVSLIERLGAARTSISLGEIYEQKSFYGVSCSSVVVRCKQLGILGQAAWGKLWGVLKKNGLVGKDAKEPRPLAPEVPRRMERLCLHAISEGAVSESKAAEILGISVRKLDDLLVPE